MTQTSKMPDAYAEKNIGLAKEVAKCRECMQQNEIRIEELDTENLNRRAYVVKLEQNFDRSRTSRTSRQVVEQVVELLVEQVVEQVVELEVDL
jgi:hypothetical protein